MIASPAFTAEDQALLMGLDLLEADLCKCSHPRSEAWHSEMDGWYEAVEYVCHACTAAAPERDGKREPVVYTHTRSTRPASAAPLPLFVLGETTSSP